MKNLVSSLVLALILIAHPQAKGDAINESAVRAHMEFLAGDALNGRGSGTRDEWIAASYMASHMRRLGLDPLGDDGGYVQKVTIERREFAAAPVLTAGNLRYTHGKEVLVQTVSAATLSGPLHTYVAGTPPPPGAAVLMPEGATAEMLSGVPGATMFLTAENALARQRWSALGARMPSLGARLAGVSRPPAARPTVIVLDKEAYAAIAKLESGTTIGIAGEEKAAQRSHTWNAVGRLRGRDASASSEVILLSAHLDHLGSRGSGADTIYNGADDDASGCVAVLQLMEALADDDRPRRTIVFALFGSEEGGGFGSRYLADKPVIPLEQIVANLQFEMIARPDPKVPARTLWLTGYERSNLGPELARRGARLVQDPHPEQSFFTRSDNIHFARRGVIAHTVSSYGLHKEYHTAEDELPLVDYRHMTEAIRSMLKPIRWLANSRFKPAWAPGGKP